MAQLDTIVSAAAQLATYHTERRTMAST